MSPLWCRHLYIGLSPDRISMLLLGRGMKPKVLAKHDELVEASGGKDWRAAMDRLKLLLERPEWHQADASVILSNRLCRFAVMPESSRTMSETAGEALARHVMKQMYGEMAERWLLCVERSKKGQPGLIATLEHELLQQLQQAAAEHRLSLKLVAPYLRSVVNRHDAGSKESNAWLVIHEPGYFLIALLKHGRIVSINGVHSELEELPALLDRECLLSDLQSPCCQVFLHAPACKNTSSIPKSPYQFVLLNMVTPSGFPSFSEGGYALPMSEFI